MLRPTLLLTLLLALAAGGCGLGEGDGDSPDRGDRRGPPVLDRPAEADDDDAAEALGFPLFATRNTTRVGGADPVADAAGIARLAYPDASRAGRPTALTLVDVDDWRAAISAAQLAAAPLRLPILFSDGTELPDATEAAIEALAPTGNDAVGDAQLVRVGATAKPEGLKSTDLTGADSAAVARAIDRVAASARSRPTREVIVASSDAPAFAMPAASLAARSGAPVLWTTRDRIPAATRQAIRARRDARIYVIGPPSAVSDGVVAQLRELGRVRRIAGPDPIRNAVAVARYADGTFGWGVIDPGHGLVFASGERPADAAAAALLSSTGKHAPLLVMGGAARVPGAVEAYLLDIQPGYDRDPVRGVYNHGWIIGDESALSGAAQAKIDALLEIQPVDSAS